MVFVMKLSDVVYLLCYFVNSCNYIPSWVPYSERVFAYRAIFGITGLVKESRGCLSSVRPRFYFVHVHSRFPMANSRS